MLNNKSLLKYSILGIFIMLPVVFTKTSPAALTAQSDSYRVEIDGVDFGEFKHVSGLERSVVSFERSFITEPSLYEWAKSSTSEKTSLIDIKVTKVDGSGNMISSYTLDRAKPLSWAVQTRSQTRAGFHEKAHIATQGISAN